MQVALEDIRSCFEGVIPSGINTCAADGTPNMTYLSHVQYVDSEHVALSWQFFNKTRKNLMENPRAAVLVVDPQAARQFELDVLYIRTETSGPLYEKMKLRLEILASLSGMTGRFRLIGADIFRVLDCRTVMGGRHSACQRACTHAGPPRAPLFGHGWLRRAISSSGSYPDRSRRAPGLRTLHGAAGRRIFVPSLH